MNDDGGCSEIGSKFQFLQPNRDPESNWEVNLAKQLEDYLLKICSGEITADEDMHISINFAEAALVIHGSVQVYSRKVEYLYSLVLQALEFISQKSGQEQKEKYAGHTHESDSHAVLGGEDDNFMFLDDVAVEAQNCLEDSQEGACTANHSVKPPATMLVLEGDCIDGGDAGELESYMLATNHLYEDFLLLDPSDAGAIYDFIKKNNNVGQSDSSVRTRTRKSFLCSPAGRVAGSANKSAVPRTPGNNLYQSPGNNLNQTPHISNDEPDMYNDNFPATTSYGGVSKSRDNSDEEEDDPWEPLNPHASGNLKIKPFTKGNTCRQGFNKRNPVVPLFPVAQLYGPISPEFGEVLSFHLSCQQNTQMTQSPPLYEKLRRSLILEEATTVSGFSNNHDDGDQIENDYPSSEKDDIEFQQDDYANADLSGHNEKQNENNANYGLTDIVLQEGPSQTSLEDLCRSHLDALLASIAETEKQTELAARVMMWKQGVESAMEEQDSHPPFDIHEYGERILDRLSSEVVSGETMSFADIVKGQQDYDIARTFGALLQLVNNRNVDIERGQWAAKSFCFTAENPFFVRLLHSTRRSEELGIHNSRKRVKSPMKKGNDKHVGKSSPSAILSPIQYSQEQNGKYSVKYGKNRVLRCTPDGKKRRRSRLTHPVDLQSA